jgi:hypothetical protein
VSRPDPLEDVRQSSDELIGELAHELSLLIRSDIELSALERGQLLRKVAIEVSVTLLAGLVFLLSLAALGWAAILGLAEVLPRGIAALLVSCGWALTAVLLLRIGPPRRLWLRLTRETHEQRVRSARRQREIAERAVRETAGGLGRTVMQEARDRELHAAASAASRAGEAAEREMEALLREFLRAVDVPARAGKRLVGKLRSTREEDASGGPGSQANELP